MARKPKLYTRLPGVTYKNFGKHTLWKGPDHLLLMYSNGMSEDYKRFYYKDILGIVTRKTASGTVVLLVILSLFLLTAGFSWHLSRLVDYLPGAVFLGITAAVFFIYLIALLIKGPSCECRIITAVQDETLRAVSLMKHARKLMTALKPLIVSAQGSMSADAVPQALETLDGLKHSREKGRTILKQSELAGKVTNPRIANMFNTALHGSLLFFAVTVAASLSQRTLLLVSLAYIFLFTAGLSSAGVLTTQGPHRSAPALKKLAWTGMAFVLAAFIQSYGEMLVLFMVKSFKGQITMDQFDMFRQYYSLKPLDYSVVTVMESVKIGAAALLGIPGVLLTVIHGRSHHESH